MITTADGEIILRAACVGGPANYDTRAASKAAALYTPEATKAQQQFKEEVDINTIVKRFGLTGELPIVERTPLDPEFIDSLDYHHAMNLLTNAEEAFADLPASIRANFDHNPANLIRFLENPDNRAKAEEMGIVIKKAAQEPPKTPPAPPAPAAPVPAPPAAG